MSIWHQITGPLYPVLDWPFNTGKNGGYNLWSGFASGGPWCVGLAMFWHRHNCHQDRCFRVVRHGKTLCKRCEKRRTLRLPFDPSERVTVDPASSV